MVVKEDGWTKSVLNYINSCTDVIPKENYTINQELYSYARYNAQEWSDFIKMINVKPWEEFWTAITTGVEYEYTLEQAKEFISFLRAFSKYIAILKKKKNITLDF